MKGSEKIYKKRKKSQNNKIKITKINFISTLLKKKLSSFLTGEKFLFFSHKRTANLLSSQISILPPLYSLLRLCDENKVEEEVEVERFKIRQKRISGNIDGTLNLLFATLYWLGLGSWVIRVRG